MPWPEICCVEYAKRRQPVVLGCRIEPSLVARYEHARCTKISAKSAKCAPCAFDACMDNPICRHRPLGIAKNCYKRSLVDANH